MVSDEHRFLLKSRRLTEDELTGLDHWYVRDQRT